MGPTHGSPVAATLLLLASVSTCNAFAPDWTALPGVWQYQGCYLDVPGRSLQAAAYYDNNMTTESCIQYCTSKSEQYAGTEWYTQCFCGSSLASGANRVDESQCNTPCQGNTTQTCGGGNRLSLYYSTAPVGPQPNPQVGGYSLLGCYTDGNGGRALAFQDASIPSGQMTAAKCMSVCAAGGYSLAGLEYAGQCFCGNSLQFGSAAAPAAGCNMPCSGNSSEICGGADRLDLYTNGPQPSPTKTGDRNLNSSSTSVRPSSASSVTGPPSTATTKNPASSSTSFASSATSVPASSVPSMTGPPSTATTKNPASSSTSFASLATSVPASSVPSMTGPSNTTTTRTATTSTATSSSLASPSFPPGWSSQGCWAEPQGGRMLNMQFANNNSNTPQLCAQKCAAAGYIISGTEFASQCFCSQAVYNGAQRTADSNCNMACTGNSSAICGGANLLNMVSKGTPQVYQPPAVQNTSLSKNWAYRGCYTDNNNNVRTFGWEVLFYQNNLTANLCLDRCAQYGYMAAGLEYGQQCFCGDPGDIAAANSTLQPDSACNTPCAGNATYICGGGNLLSTYFWTGAPLNSWSFPQGRQAGQYQFLIGGVTVPLITTQSLTGKVTFVSKWGTGPANETGSYELDLTVTNQFDLAWRPLHVKTDTFCAAGLVLPDKVGRQLTVGGWSGESTEGVRLYWPDGSPGVWGTNDWQENPNEVRLQTGRWYPGSMILANGSILVVSGEVGSNGLGVPTVEILPPNGSPPLYMSWLEESYPYNLYPFLTVLPSGRLFVGYANQSRLLDPVTLNTVKVLPMVPTAVNNDQAGRTYPLEGTMVTLPQRAPYTDPLEVLVCGGSTIGAAFALDNCVTTFPDAPNPQWRIERMPSVRVMPCMAPLPDGTYLIANGAKQGTAGFGLARDPNFNAVLYDPSKPYGSRMSSMASTSIARLYHSELLTLLDGRVLVSGSDPEDGVYPEEYRVEVFLPPYLLNLAQRPRPSWNISQKSTDWAYGQKGIPFTITGTGPRNGNFSVSLLGAVSTTHGNSFGARTLLPAFRCTTSARGVNCTVDAPPGPNIAPPGWYQMYVLDGGVPAVGKYVRIGGDPARLGNWPANLNDFQVPGL